MYFSFTYVNPSTSHLPSLSSLSLSVSVSLSPALSGRTWYSLACLSSRRLDSSNLLEQPHVLVGIIHSTKPELAALKNLFLFLSLSLQLSVFLTDLSLIPSCLAPSSPPLFLLLGSPAQTHRKERGLRQPQPPQSAG